MLRARIIRSFGIYSSVVFALLAINVVFPFYSKTENTEATDNRDGVSADATLTFTSNNLTAGVDLTITSDDGTFASSTDGTGDTEDQRITFSISTDNYTGYTLSVTPTEYYTELFNSDNDDSIYSIDSPVTETEFINNNAEDDLNNTWGFKPNYYNSVINTSNYYPAITEYDNPMVLRATNAANGSAQHADLADDYNITLGVRADYNVLGGDYINPYFNLQFVANIVGFLYTIEYDANDGADGANVTDMPDPNPNTKEYANSTVSIELDDAVPIHNNDIYTFIGWCDVQPADALSADCVDSGNNTGNILQPGDNLSVDSTISTSTTLYALWDAPRCNSSATTIGTNTIATDAVCMQDMNDAVISSMTTHTQYKLYDIRDYKVYYVAKMNDGRVWMTKNLDLDLRNDTALTSATTDLNVFGSQSYYASANGYGCVNTEDPNATLSANCDGTDEVITWTPSTTTISTDSNYWTLNQNTPVSLDGGDVYFYTSGSTSADGRQTLEECMDSNRTKEECEHYHSGNYYNWSSAVASNDTSSISTASVVPGNSVCPKGWRLPNGRTSDSVNDAGYFGEFNYTWKYEGVVTSLSNSSSGLTYATGGFNTIRTAPLYMVRAGYRNVAGTNVNSAGIRTAGRYWTSTSASNNTTYSRNAYFNNSTIYSFYDFSTATQNYRQYGRSIRCVARSSDSGKTVITFDKNSNDATGTMANQEINANTRATIDANGYSRTGYSVGGWSTEPDGNGDVYDIGAMFYAISGNSTTSVTLYAVWYSDQTITFDKNAADATCSGSNCADASTMNTQTIAAGSNANLIANSYTRPGYFFGGWMNTSNGTSTNYNDGVNYSVPVKNTASTKTLYARWIPAVTFEAGSGIETVIVIDGNQNYRSLYATPGNPVTIAKTASSAKPISVTVVPEANYVLDYWDSSLGTPSVSSLNTYKLLSTRIVSFSGGVETLTAVGVAADSNNSYPAIQDFNVSDCPLASAYNSAPGVNVTDSRDGKSYTIGKINNKCFMLSNLRLDDDANGDGKLTSTDSDVTSDFQMPTASTPSTAWSWQDVPRMVSVGGEYYYNWIAAKALGSGTSVSICPKGWTLPQYSSNNTAGDIRPADVWNSSGYNYMRIGTTGYYDVDGNRYGVGEIGSWWSSVTNDTGTIIDTSKAYRLYFSGSSISRSSDYLFLKYNGLPVRCVLK